MRSTGDVDTYIYAIHNTYLLPALPVGACGKLDGFPAATGLRREREGFSVSETGREHTHTHTHTHPHTDKVDSTARRTIGSDCMWVGGVPPCGLLPPPVEGVGCSKPL